MKHDGCIERCLWLLLAAFPVALLRAVPDQRTAEERWGDGPVVFSDRDVEYSMSICGAYGDPDLAPLPAPPPFDLLVAERAYLTELVGGFQHLADVPTPLPGRYPLHVDNAVAVADP
jgi:hypothetical protein